MTANVNAIQLKRTVIGTVPSSLKPGELMVDQNKALLYWADGSGTMHNKTLNPEGGGGPILALGNFTASGAIGTAAATVDIYGTIRVSQTTTGIALTLPTPTLTGSVIQVRVLNTGTVSFSITYNIPPGYQLRFVWDPIAVAWKSAVDINYLEQRSLVYASGIFVNPNDFVSYNNILYKYTGTAGLITTAPVTGTLWYPQSPITATWAPTASQACANNSQVTMSVTNQINNTDGSITNNGSGTITLPIAGAYQFEFMVSWAATSAAGARAIGIFVNGTLSHLSNGIQASASQVYDQMGARTLVCTAGSTIYMIAIQTSGGSISTNYNSPTSVSYLKVTFLAGQ